MILFNAFHKSQISNEDPDPIHIENDLKIINLANQKNFDDDGWDQLQNRCFTQAGRNIIHSIEMRKYHQEEYRCGML